MSTTASEYGADTIVALPGLEAVRVRPGMYIGSADKRGYHHCLWEIVDNSVDEAMAGHADRIEITLNADGSVTVVDNGRGIPVEPQTEAPYKGISSAQVALTVLHAGGKFKGEYGGFTAGLHGVGSAVVNALSEWMNVEIRRNGQIHRIGFAAVERVVKGKPKVSPAEVVSPMTASGRINKSDTGTSVSFLLDERIFTHTGWDAEVIATRLRHGAFLNPGLTFVFTDARDGSAPVTYCYPRGLQDFMSEIAAERLAESEHTAESLAPADPIVLSGKGSDGEGWDMVMQWFPDPAYVPLSFANGISTGHGGAHVKGYEQVLTSLLNRYAHEDHIGLLGEKDALTAVDVRAGLSTIIAVKVREPQFVGQTKDELSNDSTRVMVRSGFSTALLDWMNNHPAEAKAILVKTINHMRARLRIAELTAAELSKGEARGHSARMALPAELIDCETRDRSRAELFIVEGKSAAGSAKKARNADNQAILPIRGKILNVEVADQEKIQNNKEIQAIVAALGSGSGDHFDPSALRYGRIVILADADDDGKHIQMLLMTLFHRLMPALITEGKLYVSRTPLFGTTIGEQKVYSYTMEERQAVEAAHPRNKLIFSRFKGLGEMDAPLLGEHALAPATRRMARVDIEDSGLVDQMVNSLMGSQANLKWDALRSVIAADDESFI